MLERELPFFVLLRDVLLRCLKVNIKIGRFDQVSSLDSPELDMTLFYFIK